MKANSDEFQFIILGNTGTHELQIGDTTLKHMQPRVLHYLVLLLI